MAILHKQLTLPAGQAQRLDRVVQQLTGLSRRQVRGLFDHECVRLNGAVCAVVQTPAKPGDVVELHYDPQRRYHEKPRTGKDGRFTVVYEDEHLLVVDKAAFVLTVPTEEGETNTLIHALRQYLRGRGKQRAYVVHRLDRGASGLLVFAKSQEVCDLLQQQFHDHLPRREYLGVVAGIMEQERGTFRSYLATGKNLSRYSTQRHDLGELAVTHYQVEKVVPGKAAGREGEAPTEPRRKGERVAGAESLPGAKPQGRRSPSAGASQSSGDQPRAPSARSPGIRGDHGPGLRGVPGVSPSHPDQRGARHPAITLLRAWLETGRRNQIRVHFAEAGHPVLGDKRYKPELAEHPRWRARRLALHAAVLEFSHPVTGKALRFESPMPSEFARCLGGFRAGAARAAMATTTRGRV